MSIDELTIWNRRSMHDVFGETKRIAIVGNGIVEPESTPHIQKSDVVVRFNNWATRTECKEQTLPHGTLRCDVLVTHFDLHSGNMGKGSVARPRLVVIGIPSPFHIDTVPIRADRWHPDATLAMANPYWSRQLCQAMSLNSLGYAHPLPTLGLTAIYHFFRMALAATFYVCGFDWHYDPVKDTIQGHAIDATKLPTNFNHWYAREAVWTARNVFGHEQWIFSERATRTLKRVSGRTFPWEAPIAVASKVVVP